MNSTALSTDMSKVTKGLLLKRGREFLRQFFKLFCMNNYAKTVLDLFVAMLSSRLHTNFQLNIFSFEALGKPLNFTSVIEARRQNVGPVRECPKIAFLYR